jgi:hypothetical protein
MTLPLKEGAVLPKPKVYKLGISHSGIPGYFKCLRKRCHRLLATQATIRCRPLSSLASVPNRPKTGLLRTSGYRPFPSLRGYKDKALLRQTL